MVRLCITHVAFRAAVVREATAAASGARGRRRRVRSVDHNLMFVMHRAKVRRASRAWPIDPTAVAAWPVHDCRPEVVWECVCGVCLVTAED